MDTTQQQFQLPQDYWLEILQKSFLLRWEELSWINIESHIIMIKAQFSLTELQQFINDDIKRSGDTFQSIKNHEDNMKKFAIVFADCLYEMSLSGTNLDESSIFDAKNLFFRKVSTRPYPC